jgi:hypothetical protein
LDKYKLLISYFREPYSLNIFRRDINSDITMMDMTLYNGFSLLFLMLYYITSLNLRGCFYLVFFGLFVLFAIILLFRIRTYKNIQIRMMRETMVTTDDEHRLDFEQSSHSPVLRKRGSGTTEFVHSNNTSQSSALPNHNHYHREFIDIKFIEKKGKQLEINPFYNLQQFTFYSIFNNTTLENRISDVLLRCCYLLPYRPWETGFEFMDFINYVDRLSNINQIGFMIVDDRFVLYHNIEKENLVPIIVYNENNDHKLTLKDLKMVDFQSLTLPNEIEFEQYRNKRVR